MVKKNLIVLLTWKPFITQ